MSRYFYSGQNIDVETLGSIIKQKTLVADPTNTSTEFDISTYYANFLPVGYNSENYSLKKLNASNTNFKIGYSVGDNVDIANIYTTYYEDYTNTDYVTISLEGDKRKFTKAAFVLIGGGGAGGPSDLNIQTGGGGGSGSVIITKLIDLASYDNLRIKAGRAGTPAEGALGSAVKFYSGTTRNMDILAVGAFPGNPGSSSATGIGGAGGGLYCFIENTIYSVWSDTLSSIIDVYLPGTNGGDGLMTKGGQGRQIPTSPSARTYTPDVLSTAPTGGNGSSGTGYGVGGNGAGLSQMETLGGVGTQGFVRIYWYAL